MYFKKSFFQYLFLAISFFTAVKSDLPSQLNNVKVGLGALKGRLAVLKGVLEQLKEELGKENKFDEFINKITLDPEEKISQADLPPELKAIPISTEEQKEDFKENLTQTFEELPEKSLDALMGSVLYDHLSGDEKKRLVQTAATQAWVNTLEANFSSEDENIVNSSIDKFVDGATLYAEKNCAIPVPAFQQPNDFLSKMFDSVNNPEASLAQLEAITKAKEKVYKKKKSDEFAQLTNIQKNKLSAITKLTKQTLITIANAYFTARPHSLFEEKTHDLEAFQDYLVMQGITEDKAGEIITFLKKIDADNLPSLIDTNEKVENLASLTILLEFINKPELLDALREKINPTTSLNPFASFFAGGDKKLTEIQNKKDELIESQISEVSKFENKSIKQINSFIEGEKRLHTQAAKVDPNNFIVAFEQSEQFETSQQKEKFKKIIKNLIIAHKTASSLDMTKDDLEKVNLASDNVSPIIFLNESNIGKLNQIKFIQTYILLFRNVFRSHAERYSDPHKPMASLVNYLKKVFSCFDKITKILLFKNKNKILATIIEHQALINQIEQSFYEVVESFYQSRFINHQDITLDDVIHLLLHTRQGFLVNNFDYFKEILFNDVLDLSKSLCSNITIKASSISHLSEELTINLLNKIKNTFEEVEAKTRVSQDVESKVENARNNLSKLQADLKTAEKELKKAEEIDKEEAQDNIDHIKTQINKVNSLLTNIKNNTSMLVNKYIEKNFDSSKWEPTPEAFKNASGLSLRLNLENNLEAVNNWDQAIQENLGGNWRKFLINDAKARDALRETFNKLKYHQLLEKNSLDLFKALETDNLNEDSIESLILQIPQYSQYWLNLIDKLFEKIITKENALKFFKDKLTTAPEKLQNYLLVQTYLTQKIVNKNQLLAESKYLDDVLLMIEDKSSTTTLDQLKQNVPQWSSAWYTLVRDIFLKLTPLMSGHFIDLISKPSALLLYLGEHLFIDDVVNTAKKTLRHDSKFDRILIKDPRIPKTTK